MNSFFSRVFYSLMAIRVVRYHVCVWRWRFLRRNIRFLQTSETSGAVGSRTVSHNLTAFDLPEAAFGMARRMSLLIYPVAAVLKDRLPQAEVLIVGPRTEDDIFMARSMGLRRTEGLDLFSYSKYIRVGDIHNSGIASGTYDAVLLGWMISYSSDPVRVVQECKRILKPGGLLGIGIESNPGHVASANAIRVNTLNSPKDLMDLVQAPVVFSNDPYEKIVYDCGVVFKILPA